MYPLFKLVFDICLLKKGPQDIPYSAGLFFLFLPIYIATSLVILMLSVDVISALMQTMVELLLTVFYCKFVLYLAAKRPRYQQTLCALIASDALISLVAVPFMAALMWYESLLAFLCIILLMIWHWLVSGHIFRHALSQSFSFGLGIAFLYILLSYQVMAFLFPELMTNQ